MKPIVFHPDVSIDIKGSYEWYEKQIKGLGSSFIQELESSYEKISNFPKTWSTFNYGFKRFILSRFPFSIIYKEKESEILTIAVMHNSRKPNYWIKRLER